MEFTVVTSGSAGRQAGSDGARQHPNRHQTPHQNPNQNQNPHQNRRTSRRLAWHPSWLRLALIGMDSGWWLAALVFATVLRYEASLDQIETVGLVAAVVMAVVLQIVLGVLLKLYQGGYRLGSFDEAIVVVSGGTLIGAVMLLADLVGDVLIEGPSRLVPLSVPFGGTMAAALGMLMTRAVLRLVREGHVRPREGAPTLVFGAGDGGHQLIRSMVADASSPYTPVGLLDDDPRKRHLRINGVRVLGTRADLARVVRETGAHALVVAVPSGDSALYRAIAHEAHRADLEVQVLPGLGDLLTPSQVSISDVRDIDVTDLLGRHQIDTDIDAIAGYLTGKRVLVTGAGGSIGSELCRQLYRFGPAELIMLDRDESALHSVQLSLHGRAMLDTGEVVLADIRDHDRMFEIFAERRPHVVFHAAALKHVPMLEQYPAEGYKTNVLGTAAVLAAARRTGVERFVNISTDKAANPINVLGRSKRLAEQVTAHCARDSAGTYLSVRFGNVLGSRGSVLTAFARQIADGGPVTVTDPDVTRYFMTIAEAVQLVIQAAAIGRDGEALVLDMGEPVRIVDLARQLIEMADNDVEIVFTGLRDGEKMDEELFGRGETDERPFHPLISHVDVPALSPDGLDVEAVIGPEAETGTGTVPGTAPGTTGGAGEAPVLAHDLDPLRN